MSRPWFVVQRETETLLAVSHAEARCNGSGEDESAEAGGRLPIVAATPHPLSLRSIAKVAGTARCQAPHGNFKAMARPRAGPVFGRIGPLVSPQYPFKALTGAEVCRPLSPIPSNVWGDKGWRHEHFSYGHGGHRNSDPRCGLDSMLRGWPWRWHQPLGGRGADELVGTSDL